MGSTPSRSAVECNPGQVVNTCVPLSPSSIIWYYQPLGSAGGLASQGLEDGGALVAVWYVYPPTLSCGSWSTLPLPLQMQ